MEATWGSANQRTTKILERLSQRPPRTDRYVGEGLCLDKGSFDFCGVNELLEITHHCPFLWAPWGWQPTVKQCPLTHLLPVTLLTLKTLHSYSRNQSCVSLMASFLTLLPSNCVTVCRCIHLSEPRLLHPGKIAMRWDLR
jgi:hypothetical protein